MRLLCFYRSGQSGGIWRAKSRPDGLEITKPNVHVELPIKADIKEFCKSFGELLDAKDELPAPKTSWISTCKKWRSDYPVVTKERHYKKSKFTNIYWFIHELDKMIPDNAPIITGNGSAVVASASIISIRNNQRFIFNSGCASMGWGLPASIGACLANGKNETYCVTGDGSIQMNLQELQTLVFHKLPIKIFLINNQGYHSIRQTQSNLFSHLSKVGIGPESGDLSFPDMAKIAAAYGIPYFSIHSDDEISGVLPEFISHNGFALLEIFVDTEQGFEPKPSARKLNDGTLVSPPLEDLYPFLDRDVLRKIMFIPLVGEE